MPTSPLSPQLRTWLEEQVIRHNQPSFIPDDPISLPHQFSQQQDIEIIGFWVAMLAWGRRTTIINSGKRLIELMDGAPYDFIKHHEESDRERFLAFKHRTFQPLDALYFLEFLQQHYQQHDSLQTAFSRHLSSADATIENALIGFHEDFFALPDAPQRTRKHVATPARKSTCKRLCMFLRWMVRRDDAGVDFGLWRDIAPRQLLLPLDVHVERVGRQLGLLTRKQRDWKAVLELTEQFRALDPDDPAKYDYALFGAGVLSEGLL